MRIMAKIKELLAGREKLTKYDELTEWKRRFETAVDMRFAAVPPHLLVGLELPSHIKEIIVNALDAEIKKLDEE